MESTSCASYCKQLLASISFALLQVVMIAVGLVLCHVTAVWVSVSVNLVCQVPDAATVCRDTQASLHRAVGKVINYGIRKYMYLNYTCPVYTAATFSGTSRDAWDYPRILEISGLTTVKVTHYTSYIESRLFSGQG